MTFTVEWVWFSGFSDWYSEWYSKFRFSVLIWICLQRENCIAACMMGVEFTAVRACYHTITKMIMILIIFISQIHFKYFTFLEQVWQFDYHPMRSLLRFSIFRIVARQSRQDLIQEVANWVAIAIQFACCIWSYHQALLYGHCNCTLSHSKKSFECLITWALEECVGWEKLGQLIEDASEHKNKLAMRHMSLLWILLGLIKVKRILYRPLQTSVFLNLI